MIKDQSILKNLVKAVVLLAIVMICMYIFMQLTDYYILDASLTPHPIDSHVEECKCFDAEYVKLAKYGGYDHARYYWSFALLDLIFPLVYTFMFMCVLQIYSGYKFYIYLRWLAIAGCVFDYLENFSFAVYLQLKGPGFASVVAFFTAIKSVLFLINLIVFFGGFVWGVIQVLKKGNRHLYKSTNIKFF